MPPIMNDAYFYDDLALALKCIATEISEIGRKQGPEAALKRFVARNRDIVALINGNEVIIPLLDAMPFGHRKI